MLNFPPYYAWLFNQIWSRKRCFFLNIVFPRADTFDIQKPSMKQNIKKSAKSKILLEESVAFHNIVSELWL